jgi:hypothetical protein
MDQNKDIKKTIISSLKGKLITRMKHLLIPQGFVKVKNASWDRYTNTLRQSFEFRQLRGEFDIRYGYLIQDNINLKRNEWAYSKDFEKTWQLPKTSEEISTLLEKLMQHIQEIGLFFFSQYMESSHLINDYEKGIIDISYFGLDPGWQHYSLGTAYFSCKEYEKSRENFLFVIDQCSTAPHDFIQDRKKASITVIEQITQLTK